MVNINPNTMKILTPNNIPDILPLIQQLNPNTPIEILEDRQQQMFQFDNYKCFGFYKNEKLIGLSSGWITVKLYSGKQIEMDNVIMDSTFQSKGYGKLFVIEIEAWAVANDCKTVELNAYVQNDKAHKFYFKEGYRVIGFHFQKEI